MRTSLTMTDQEKAAQKLHDKILQTKKVTNADIVEYGKIMGYIQNGHSAKDLTKILIGDNQPGVNSMADAGYAMQKIIKANKKKKFGESGRYMWRAFGSEKAVAYTNPRKNLEALHHMAINHIAADLFDLFAIDAQDYKRLVTEAEAEEVEEYED